MIYGEFNDAHCGFVPSYELCYAGGNCLTRVFTQSIELYIACYAHSKKWRSGRGGFAVDYEAKRIIKQ